MKRYIFSIIASLFLSFNLYGQGLMRDLFKQIPDSLLPILTANNRLDLIDFIESNMQADVKNVFDKHTRLDTLTNNYLKLTLTASTTLEMRLLNVAEPVDSSRQVICTVTTYGGDFKESSIRFYSAHWKPLEQQRYLDVPQLTARPDSMPIERYNKLLQYLIPNVYSATLSPTADVLHLTQQHSILVRGDNEPLTDILKPKTLKWDGKNFKNL